MNSQDIIDELERRTDAWWLKAEEEGEYGEVSRANRSMGQARGLVEAVCVVSEMLDGWKLEKDDDEG